jgi:hypothetical protein
MEQTEIPLSYFSSYLRMLEEENDENCNVDGDGSGVAPVIIYLAQQNLFNYVHEIRHHPLPITLQAIQSSKKVLPSKKVLQPFDIYSRVSWMGPNNTFSPYHVDPHHNCFEQHRGCKKFRLLSSTDSKRMKRSDDILQRNTILLQDDDDDSNSSSSSSSCENIMEVIVNEGEELFFPMHMMHEVTSLCGEGKNRKKTSVSTTTWWRPRYRE